MFAQVEQKMPEAFSALQKYAQQHDNKSDDILGSSLDQNYRLRVEFHNVDLKQHMYPMFTVRLPHQAYYSGSGRTAFVLPDNSDKLFSLQLSAQDLYVMNNSADARINLVNKYDVFYIDETLQTNIMKYGGQRFIRQNRVVFVADLHRYREDEVYCFTSIPTLLGFEFHVVVANTTSEPQQATENVISLLKQISDRIPFGLRNIRKVSLNRRAYEARLELPLYITIKKAGQTLVTDERSAFEVMFDEIKQAAIRDGLLDE